VGICAFLFDVGLGDAIVPAAKKLEYPTLLKSPAPKLHVYSKESVVAEKFEAMVKTRYREQPNERLSRSLSVGAKVRNRERHSRRGHPGDIQNAAYDPAEAVAAGLASRFL